MVLLLIDLFRTHKTQFRSARHMKAVWMKIADGMRNEGYNLSWQVCEKKFRNMKGTYKGIKDNNRQSGRGRKQWPYYQLFDDILGSVPAIDPQSMEMGAAANDTDTVAEVHHHKETTAATGNTDNQSPSEVMTESEGWRTRKRRRKCLQEPPAWFTEYVHETKETEGAKLNLLQAIHEHNKQSAREKLDVMKELNANIKTLINKL